MPCISCQPRCHFQLPPSFQEWQHQRQQRQPQHQSLVKRQLKLPSQFRASLSLTTSMRSSTTMLRLRSSVTPSAHQSLLSKIKSFNVSLRWSLSIQSTQGRTHCSSASSSRKFEMADHPQQCGRSLTRCSSLHWVIQVPSRRLRDPLQHQSGLRSVLPRPQWVRVQFTENTWLDQVTKSLRMRCQITSLRSIVPFTCSTGLVMRSITCTTSELLMASCTTVT